MGVSGSGKTTVGRTVAGMLSMPFYDADNYHDLDSLEKMKNNIPLQDEDRHGWINLLSKKIQKWNSQGNAVLACSALKSEHRKQMAKNGGVIFVFLDGEYELIHQRLTKRKGHFFSAFLLESQFEDLERPKDGITVSIDSPVMNICSKIIKRIQPKHAR